MSRSARIVLAFAAFAGPFNAALELPHCPGGYCVERKYAGETYESFQCAQYNDTGYQCGFEGGPCWCDGYVKYGNYEVWGDEAESNPMLMCNNDLGHPVHGAKFCFCRRRNPIATAHSVVEGWHASREGSGSEPPEGYSEATCINTPLHITIMSDSITQLPYFEGAARFASTYAFAGMLEHDLTAQPPPITEVQAADLDTMQMVVKVPANGDLAGSMAKIDAAQAAEKAKPLKDAMVATLEAHRDTLGELTLFGGLVEFEVPALPAAPTPAPTPPTPVPPTPAPPAEDASRAKHLACGPAALLGLWCMHSCM